MSLFGPDAQADLWVEIGFGGGEHLADQAAAHRDIAMIGCEPFINGVASLLSSIDAEALANIRIYSDDGATLLRALPDRSVGRLCILFPDPWPKARHHKRRLITGAFVDEAARVLKSDAELRFATDHRGYRQWTLARLVGHRDFRWICRDESDWRTRPGDWPETRYEGKARVAGRDCVYLRFRRRARNTTPKLEARANSRI
jgi:tRNA (guanine-N7-)-methyltransferase